MRKGNIAIIGGTGFEQLPPEIFAEAIEIETRFGVAKVLSVSNNYVEPFKLYFLSRHGASHGLAPHEINYHANIAALQELDVAYAFATNAVGSLKLSIPPESLLLVDDFLDFNRNRPLTYFSHGDKWHHTDFSVPYSPILRSAVLKAAEKMSIPIIPKGTYVCCDGPRFETPAEVRLFASWGGDVVGMTGLPEAIFAKEAGIEYSALTIITNYGVGLTENAVQHGDVVKMMQNLVPMVRELLLQASGILMEEITQNNEQ